MPNRSNASDSSYDRAAVAEDLYRKGGAANASSRCDVNARLGQRDLLQDLLAALALRPAQTVVDVGCGAGQHLEAFARAVGPDGCAHGFDFSPAAVEATRRRGQRADVASAERLPLDDGVADAVACSYAVYYFEDVRAAAAEWHRILRPSGRLVVSGPAAGSNAELYDFHLRATGRGPSDADRMALGYVATALPPILESLGFCAIDLLEFDNPVTFPDRAAFLDYWESTSLFQRTAGATRAQGERTLPDTAFTITKRVTVLRAERGPA